MANEPWVPLNTIKQDIEAHALVLLDPNSETALPVSSLFVTNVLVSLQNPHTCNLRGSCGKVGHL